jgi:hypothetical protein
MTGFDCGHGASEAGKLDAHRGTDLGARTGVSQLAGLGVDAEHD